MSRAECASRSPSLCPQCGHMYVLSDNCIFLCIFPQWVHNLVVGTHLSITWTCGEATSLFFIRPSMLCCIFLPHPLHFTTLPCLFLRFFLTLPVVKLFILNDDYIILVESVLDEADSRRIFATGDTIVLFLHTLSGVVLSD